MNIEGNKLIAKFMELETPDNIRFEHLNKKGERSKLTHFILLEYHLSWDWLMPVVERIEQYETVDVDILQYGTKIHNYKTGFEYVNNISNISFENKIEHTYNAVVEFINNLDNNIKNF